MGPNDKHDKPPTDPLAFIDTVMDHVAQEEAEADEVEFTPEEDRWARGVRQNLDTHLAALRRQLTPAQPTHKHLAPIPDEIRALDREGLLARLEILCQSPHARARYTPQDLTGLTTDELRQMVVMLESTDE